RRSIFSPNHPLKFLDTHKPVTRSPAKGPQYLVVPAGTWHNRYRSRPIFYTYRTGVRSRPAEAPGGSMKFHRTYSTPEDRYAGLTFEPRTSRIANPDGSVIFEAKDVMVPSDWSQVAVDVLAQKYCRKAGVPRATERVAEEGVPEWLWRSAADRDALEAMPRDDQFGPERDARQVFERLAGCWTYWGWKY